MYFNWYVLNLPDDVTYYLSSFLVHPMTLTRLYYVEGIMVYENERSTQFLEYVTQERLFAACRDWGHSPTFDDIQDLHDELAEFDNIIKFVTQYKSKLFDLVPGHKSTPLFCNGTASCVSVASREKTLSIDRMMWRTRRHIESES